LGAKVEGAAVVERAWLVVVGGGKVDVCADEAVVIAAVKVALAVDNNVDNADVDDAAADVVVDGAAVVVVDGSSVAVVVAERPVVVVVVVGRPVVVVELSALAPNRDARRFTATCVMVAVTLDSIAGVLVAAASGHEIIPKRTWTTSAIFV
jgi:hypothetical protein